MRRSVLLTVAFSAIASLLSAQPANPSLPRVLILGDSISIGYTPPLAELLAGEAVVVHNPGNGRHTGIGLEKLDAWLGDEPWDVIHFNWGLHDLCHRSLGADQRSRKDKANGKVDVPLADYEANLDRLVERLKGTGAKLVWATTTLVPEGEPGRLAGDEVRYNEAAVRVMQRHGVPTNDLHTLSAGLRKDLFVRPGDVHYTKAGYARLAEQTAAAVRESLRP